MSNCIAIYQRTPQEMEAFVAKHKGEWEEEGSFILRLRNNLRVSKKALAERAGICVNTLSKLENGLYIRRFKAISKSCENALNLYIYEAMLAQKK